MRFNKSNKAPWFNYSTENDCSFQFAGHLFYNNRLLSSEETYTLLKNKIQSNQFNINFIKEELKGQFGFVFEDKTHIYAFVDKIRSFPLFYYGNKISHDCSIFELESETYNDQALLEFNMAGYTLGNKTLYNNLTQILPGEYIVVDKKDNSLTRHRHYRYYDNDVFTCERKNLLKLIDNVVNQSIEKTIEIAAGRKIIIPLSAGYDSRLLLGKLIEFGYNNILCYTYGPKNIWEAKVASKVCKNLNIPWEFVSLTSKDKSIFDTKERREYYTKASGYCSIPHLADFYALKKLIDNKIINPSDSLIINGQSGDFISGGHIRSEVKQLEVNFILKNFISKHFSLWENLKIKNNLISIENEIKVNLEMSFNTTNPEILAKQFELIECEERQFKYVVNGQRAYEYYDIDWYLPFWSDEFLAFFSKLSIDDKLHQNAYIEYCESYNPSSVFDVEMKGNINSLPYSLKVINLLLRIFSKVISIDKAKFRKRYLNYFDKYAPYYPMRNYFVYLKDSKYHRHCVSFWVKYFIQELRKD